MIGFFLTSHQIISRPKYDESMDGEHFTTFSLSSSLQFFAIIDDLDQLRVISSRNPIWRAFLLSIFVPEINNS